MLQENVASQAISHLIREYLLVDSPRQWLSHLILKIGDSSHSRILRVVSVNDAHEVIFGECLEVVEQVFDHLVVSLLVV